MKKIGRFYTNNIYDEVYDDSRTIVNVLSLQSWLKANKIPYMFTSGLWLDYTQMNEDMKSMVDMIDLKRYFNAMDSTFHMYKICDAYPKGPRHHPLEEGHAAWASMLYQYIQENKWMLKYDII